MFNTCHTFINCAAHFINPYVYTFTLFRARARVRARVRAYFFTEAPAEFQHQLYSHVNCMIV